MTSGLLNCPTLVALPAGTLQALLLRIAACGIWPQEHEDRTGGYHCEGVVFRSGVLYWHPRAYLDTLVHETAHVLFIPISERGTWGADNMPTGGNAGGEGDELLAVQVALEDGIPGLSIEQALADMDSIGYGFDVHGGAYGWWRAVGQDALPRVLPWRRCLAVKQDGTQCKGRRIRNGVYCFFHSRLQDERHHHQTGDST